MAGHSVEEWAETLGLKHRGREAVGPCPLCGGRDRFHVKPGRDGAALVGCRGCIDGQPEDVRRTRFGELQRTVFGKTDGRHPSSSPVQPRRTHLGPGLHSDTSPGAEEHSTASAAHPFAWDCDCEPCRLEKARRTWRRGVLRPGDPQHPARLWLADRHLWPSWVMLPPILRWLPYGGTDRTRAGDVVAAVGIPGAGKLSGVHMVHVDDAGRKVFDSGGRDKVDRGLHTGAVCIIGMWPPGASSMAVHVAEGLADCLAIASRRSEPVVCMNGTSNYRRADLAEWLARFDAVTVWPDSEGKDDGRGLGTARDLGRRIANGQVAAGRASSVQLAHVDAEDPGAAGAPFPVVDLARWRSMAAAIKAGGLPRWDAERRAAAKFFQEHNRSLS